MKIAKFWGFTFLAGALAYGCTPVVAEGEGEGERDPLTPVIAELPSEVELGTVLTLDTSGTADIAFDVSWQIDQPSGCERGVLDSSTAVITEFTTLCVGDHVIAVEVSEIGSDIIERAEVRVNVVLPEDFLALALVESIEAPLNQEAELRISFDDADLLDVLRDEEPVQVEVTPETAGVEAPAVRLSEDLRSVFVEMNAPHERYAVSVTLSLADGEFTSEPLEIDVVTLNSGPVVEDFTVDAFDAGEGTEITATVSDLDGDEVSCALAFADVDPQGPTFTLPEPSTTCSFTVTPPSALAQWTLELSTDDGFEAPPGDVELVVLSPNNAAPEVDIQGVINEVETGYTCDATTCTTDIVDINILALDDIDDAADLVYGVVEAAALPEGVTLTAVDEQTVGLVRISLSAPRGQGLAGDYGLLAQATEITFAEGATPNTGSQSFTLRVNNTAPTIDVITMDDVNHTFASQFVASVDASFTIVDAEGDASLSMRIVSCSTGDFVATNCGDVSVDVASIAGASGTFNLSSPSISTLVTAFVVEFSASDPDGGTGSATQTVNVLNRPPVPSPTASVQQTFDGTEHSATFTIFTDPDGDPLNPTNLSLECDAGCVASANFNGGAVTISGPGDPAFIDSYTFGGHITDGVDVVETDIAQNVTNTPPTVTFTSPGRQTLNHRTVGNTVTADNSLFTFTASTADINGDPLEVVAVNSAEVQLTGTTTFTAGNNTVQYDRNMTYAEFEAAFQNDQWASSFVFRDPFGAESAVITHDSALGNRLPPNNFTVTLDYPNGLRYRRNLSIDIVLERGFNSGANRSAGGVANECSPFFCGDPYIPADVGSNVVDPDGDPLRADVQLSCPGSLGTIGVSDLSDVAYATSFERRLVGTETTCGGDTYFKFRTPNDALECTATVTVRDAALVPISNSATESQALVLQPTADPCVDF